MKDWREHLLSGMLVLLKGLRNGFRLYRLGKSGSLWSYPVYWEEKGLDGLDGIVWFQKEIDIPAEWAGKGGNS